MKGSFSQKCNPCDGILSLSSLKSSLWGEKYEKINKIKSVGTQVIWPSKILWSLHCSHIRQSPLPLFFSFICPARLHPLLAFHCFSFMLALTAVPTPPTHRPLPGPAFPPNGFLAFSALIGSPDQFIPPIPSSFCSDSLFLLGVQIYSPGEHFSARYTAISWEVCCMLFITTVSRTVQVL